jgi:hypothetical protein
MFPVSLKRTDVRKISTFEIFLPMRYNSIRHIAIYGYCIISPEE